MRCNYTQLGVRKTYTCKPHCQDLMTRLRSTLQIKSLFKRSSSTTRMLLAIQEDQSKQYAPLKARILNLPPKTESLMPSNVSRRTWC